jgi:hypothetical protein
LKIVGAMFLRPEPAPAFGSTNLPPAEAGSPMRIRSIPVTLAIALSVAGTLLFGSILPATAVLTNQVTMSSRIESTDMRGTTTPPPPPAVLKASAR